MKAFMQDADDLEGVTDFFPRNWTVIKNILHMLSYSELLVNIADT